MRAVTRLRSGRGRRDGSLDAADLAPLACITHIDLTHAAKIDSVRLAIRLDMRLALDAVAPQLIVPLDLTAGKGGVWHKVLKLDQPLNSW
jgi:hypothetical protein